MGNGGRALPYVGYNLGQEVYTCDSFNSMGEAEHSRHDLQNRNGWQSH
jgi:hypothetical protein